jgi:hypothetical protein
MAQVMTSDFFEQTMELIVIGILREIDARIEDAMKQLVFKGAWVEGRQYQKRNLTSVGGAIYLCSADTDSRPGVSNDWALLIPKPRDHRDVPEQRTARTDRSSSEDPVVMRRR